MLPFHPSPCFRLLAGLLVLLALAWPAQAQETEKRIALVIGNAAYADGALPTTANDAGLIAEQLQAAGFDVSGARDLNGDALRGAFRDFVGKARQAGPGQPSLSSISPATASSSRARTTSFRSTPGSQGARTRRSRPCASRT